MLLTRIEELGTAGGVGFAPIQASIALVRGGLPMIQVLLAAVLILIPAVLLSVDSPP